MWIVGSYFLGQGSNLGPQHQLRQLRVLTIGLPGIPRRRVFKRDFHAGFGVILQGELRSDGPASLHTYRTQGKARPEPWGPRGVHPESSPPPSIPSVALSHSSIWGLGHPGSPGTTFQIYKHPLGMLLRSQQPTLSVAHNTSEGNKGSNPEWPSGPSEKFQRREEGCD